MSELTVVEAQLNKKEIEILMLEEKLKVARVYVRALQDVLKEIKRGTSSELDDPEFTLRRGSTVAQAREVILARGEPIYIDDLLHMLGKEVTREAKASLTGSLAAYVRKGEVFTRPAPSTFGLIELQHFGVDTHTQQPPLGFGLALDNATNEGTF